ncbi:MAG: methylated-DNA--[protein]-cysteine S-methyltransferase [Chloroflexota bacterium]
MDQAKKDTGAAYKLARVETAFGWVGLVASERGLVALEFPLPTRDEVTERLLEVFSDNLEVDDNAFPELSESLTRYFAGEQVEFNAAVDERLGTPFQRKAWDSVRSIPYGQTMSYGEVARRMGRPGAARAVGSAMRANPVPIVIPCHRVIGSSGTLTGFGGGLDLKRRLLRLEGADRTPNR